VLDALHEFKVDVEAAAGDRYDQGPAIYLVRVVPGRGTTADKLMARRTDLKLRLGLAQEFDIRTYADRGAVVFEIPKAPEERYPVDAEQMWARAPAPEDRLVVAVGENIAGEVMTVDLSSSESPHLLIAGTTGSGKSVALETILAGLCQSKPPAALRLHLVDPKGTELTGFEDSAHLAGDIGMDADDAIATLETAVEEMQRRYALFKSRRVRDLAAYNAAVDPAERQSWWVVVLDEYADLTADPAEKRAIEALLRRLAQKARAAGIHLIIATQRPSADVISPVVRSNLPAQLALRVRTAIDSRVILDEAGAETLAGMGDALLRTARGTTRIQSGMVRPAP
jgi:DNA segregation ATPase FtsK/SpoIIIE, S-DNA-T family